MIKRMLVLLAVLSAGMPAHAGPAVPLVEGPDVPPTTEPIAVVQAFTDERFECTEVGRRATVAVPGGWNRAVLEVTITPDGDPWDRLFGVSIEGVEVMRGTTPRTKMTVRRDITEYRALLAGDTADVQLYMGSYVGALLGSVRLLFYAEQNPLALRAPAADVVDVFAFRWLRGNATQGAEVGLPDQAPSAAALEITLSGHGAAESTSPRPFRVLVDGQEVATLRTMVYAYAFLGFGNANANTACVGPGTSTFGDTVHPVMWWTAQQGLNAAGVHTGNGEIPPYRAEIAPEHLPLLTGSREIKLVQGDGSASWLGSLSILLR